MLGGWGETCVRRRRWLLVAWLVVIIGGGVSAPSVIASFANPQGAASAESVRGFHALDKVDPVGDTLLGLTSAPGRLDLAALAAAEGRVRHVPHVLAVQGPTDGGPDLVSRDGRGALSVISVSRAVDRAHTVSDVLPQVRRALALPGTHVIFGGNAVEDHDLNTSTESDTSRAEVTSLPVAMVLMFFVFGGLLPAALPLVAAGASIAGCLILLLAAGTFLDITSYTFSTASMLGLGLSVDYSLLLVHRYREERRVGHEHERAVARSVATAGRTIAFSALTVVASLTALAVFDDPLFRSLAVGGIAVVLVAGLAGTTFTPALLAAFGHRIKPGHDREEDVGAFSRIAEVVQRRPWPVAVGCTALLLAAAVPFLGVKFHQFDERELAASSPGRQVAQTIQTAFPGGGRPSNLTVVTHLSADSEPVTTYETWARALPEVSAVSARSLPGSLTAIDVRPRGVSEGPQAQTLVHALRDHRLEPKALVTGEAAFLVDSVHNVSVGLPGALVLLSLATLVLLFLMTGSVVVPVKALLISLISLGATFGALTWIFQEGHLSGLLGFTSSGATDIFVPVLVFTFAFGLSMDYEVFLLARIKEAVDQGEDDNRAVSLGLQRSGRIVTAAALLIIVVFIGFATGSTVPIKEIGVGLALAVFIDATLVRCLLVPATMTLLGRRNWWAPAPLKRLAARSGLQH